MVALTCAPLLVHVEPNVNIVTTATLAVYVGCCRSLKKVRCVEAMSQGDAMRCVALQPNEGGSRERPVRAGEERQGNRSESVACCLARAFSW